MKCKSCSIDVKSPSDNCPLCGKYLSEFDSPRELPYPNIEKEKNGIQRKALKIVLFSVIASCIALFTVNMLTYSKYLWSIIPISSLLVAFLTVGIPVTLRRITPFMIIFDNVMICIYLVILDVAIGYRGWAMGRVVPFVLSGSSMVVTIVVMFTKMTWRRLYLFEMAIAIICFIPLIMRGFFEFVFWPSIVSAAYGLITIIGMIIFGDRRLKYEAKKRFHF